MSDDTNKRSNQGAVIPVSDVPHAPFIFYEWAPVFGHQNGVINLTLTANRTYISPASVQNEQVVVAHLRSSVAAAAASLRKALDDALLLAKPTPDGKSN